MNRLIRDAVNLSPEMYTQNTFGVEIEVEGKSLPPAVPLWRVEGDGSLRGESCEYVLRKPQTLGRVREALDNLDKAYVDAGTEVAESVRAGVHVHINVQDLTVQQMWTMVVLYLVLEECMVEWCGDSRVGNHFCLRASDAGYLVHCMKRSIRGGALDYLHDDKLRYSSLNVVSLHKFGSLEFRAMRGTRDLDTIFTWAKMLGKLREAALEFDTPIDVVQVYSHVCVEDFLERVLGGFADEVRKIPKYPEKILSGVRTAQEIAYASDWKEQAKPEAKKYRGQPLREPKAFDPGEGPMFIVDDDVVPGVAPDDGMPAEAVPVVAPPPREGHAELVRKLVRQKDQLERVHLEMMDGGFNIGNPPARGR